jgi:hypothetical protein
MVDRPVSEQPPHPGKTITLEDLVCIRKRVWLYDTASIPEKSITSKKTFELRKATLEDCIL